MAVALTITDAADGTGATATVSGVSALATTDVYVGTFTGHLGAIAFSLATTITGNASALITLPVGYYLFQGISAGVLASPVYQNVSDNTTPTIHKRILDGVANRINQLGFPWLPPTKVLERWFPKVYEQTEKPPVCYVSPVGSEQYADMVVGQDDPGFPVLVVLVDAAQALNNIGNVTVATISGTPQIVDNTRLLDWRIRVSRALRNQRLPGVIEVWKMELEPDAILDVGAFLKNYAVSVLTFKATVREGRGLTTV